MSKLADGFSKIPSMRSINLIPFYYDTLSDTQIHLKEVVYVGAILIGYGPDDKVKSILWYNQATIDGLEATINEDESELVKDSSIQEESTNNDNSLETSISESNGEYWVLYYEIIL